LATLAATRRASVARGRRGLPRICVRLPIIVTQDDETVRVTT
jgi:hypothetical protein